MDRVTVWIVLLRAINLGARNRVPMTGLRTTLAEAGLPDARTLLQSGNVVVRSGSDAGLIVRRVLFDEFGVDQPVLVRSHTRLAEIIARNPFPEAAAERPTLLRVLFLPEPLPTVTDTDCARVRDCEVYLDYQGQERGRSLAPVVDRKLAAQSTERNWSTILKLAALAESVA